MRAPVSWIQELVALPDDVSAEQLAARLTELGLKLEALHAPGDQIKGPLVLGRVLTIEKEPQKNGKVINWCTVDVGDSNGTGQPQGIICGAHNFLEGDLVVVCLPGAVLPGNFEISERKTYGHLSAGMICSARELGLGDDHEGIIVLPAGTAEPGADAFEVLGLNETTIEFEINPDRAYALSLRGVAREAALAFDLPYVDPALRETPAANDSGYPVVVDDPAGCPVFVTRTVTGFDPAARTPDWMVQRLEQCGMRPISLAVDVSNYVMLELGNPNHCYDRAQLQGPIRVRRATAGEKIVTLDGVTRELDPQDLLITDDSGPIGLAGVMGGESTEISAATTDVVIETAHFDPVTIFRAQKRHKLGSEASKRFERGVDPALPQAAADRVAELLVELGGGTIDPGVTVVGAAPARRTITAPAAQSAHVTGMEITADQAVQLLEAVGCAVTVDGEMLTATVPSWRPDMSEPFDLVEEVARQVGYENVPSVLPAASAGRGLTREQRLRRRVGRTLAGAGLVEVVSFPFVGDAAFDQLGLAGDDARRDTVRLENPLSSEEPAYTTTLLPGLLKTAARNVGRGAPGVGIFETATVAFPAGNGPAPILGVDRRPDVDELAKLLSTLPHQPLHLGVVLSGEQRPAGWQGAVRDADWTDAVAVVRALADELAVDVELANAAHAPWHPGRCARLLVEGLELGYAGELHPKVCQAFGLPARSSAVELDLDVLLSQVVDVRRAPAFSSYPVAKEDVALIVDATTPAAAVEAALREGAGELLESIRLFDVFTGAQIGEGKKSLAYALRLRAPDRTLKEGEASAARDAAVALAAERTGAVQRA
jgi:phenylalanyl-tRNA synthetase beta chain